MVTRCGVRTRERAATDNGNMWGASLGLAGDLGWGRLWGVYGMNLGEIPTSKGYRD